VAQAEATVAFVTLSIVIPMVVLNIYPPNGYGDSYKVDVLETQTVAQLKADISKKVGLEVGEMMLKQAARHLPDDYTMASLGFTTSFRVYTIHVYKATSLAERCPCSECVIS